MKPINRKLVRTALVALMVFAASTVNAQNHFSGPRNMGTVVNSTMSDQAPTISPNGLSLYFASNRPTTLGQMDIYVSKRATLNSAWGAPQNVAALNSAAVDNGPSFSIDGRTMFFQSSRTPGGLGGGDIYISTRTDPNDDFGWTAPVNVGPVINTSSGEIGPTYFEDPVTGAGTLIFSSDRVGIPGVNFHFYQSTRNANGTFNPPTLITELNSEGAEFGAAIRRDGLQIYFGSSRPGELVMGKFDIWVATRTSVSAPWGTPTLATGINSLDEDRLPRLSPDGSIIYFYSDRPGGSGPAGVFDLYSATRCSLYSDMPCAVNRPAADFDADGQTDLSVFRPSDGTWWILNSETKTVSVRQFGAAGDKPVSGDYDGDNRLDVAIFRPSSGSWWILRSSDNTYYVVNLGAGTDHLVPGDYDSDGKTDEAVFQNGTWSVLRSSDGQLREYHFGISGDVPVAE